MLIILSACTNQQVVATVAAPTIHDDMLEALREGVESELEQSVVIDVGELRKNKRWAFVTGVSLTAEANRIISVNFLLCGRVALYSKSHDIRMAHSR